jgi:hypothetical protein
MDPERDMPPVGDEVAEVGYYAPLREALLISRPFDAYTDLLVPREGSDEWEVWAFRNDGADAYRSFAAFLRNQINAPDRRPDPALADLYAAEGRLRELAEIGDPRVTSLAFAVLLDPTVDEYRKRGWAEPVGLVGHPNDVGDLRRVYAEATHDGFRMELLHALIRCGDPDVEKTLQAIADDPNDDARRWAAYVLPRLHRRG